ncbi:MAG: hypothetical protein U5K56_00810 [Halioglobus sp.]|nr:hypothetical protein [Halioglobus sp.]
MTTTSTTYSNNGKAPGGAVLVIEYEGIEDDDWYVWKDKEYDPDFYFERNRWKSPSACTTSRCSRARILLARGRGRGGAERGWRHTSSHSHCSGVDHV